MVFTYLDQADNRYKVAINPFNSQAEIVDDTGTTTHVTVEQDKFYGKFVEIIGGKLFLKDFECITPDLVASEVKSKNGVAATNVLLSVLLKYGPEVIKIRVKDDESDASELYEIDCNLLFKFLDSYKVRLVNISGVSDKFPKRLEYYANDFGELLSQYDKFQLVILPPKRWRKRMDLYTYTGRVRYQYADMDKV